MLCLLNNGFQNSQYRPSKMLNLGVILKNHNNNNNNNDTFMSCFYLGKLLRSDGS